MAVSALERSKTDERGMTGAAPAQAHNDGREEGSQKMGSGHTRLLGLSLAQAVAVCSAVTDAVLPIADDWFLGAWYSVPVS